MNTKEKIVRARTLLLLDHPFFGCLAMKLKFQQADEMVPSAATDGKTLFYNSNFIEELSSEELQFVLAHVTMHLAMGHCWRKGDRDSTFWNVAGDYSINEILTQSGFRMPKVGLLEPNFYNKNVEEIYNIVYQKSPEGGKGGKGGKGDGKIPDPGMCGAVIPSQGKAEDKQLEAEWKAAAAQAAQMCRGDIPTNLKRMINDVINPPLPWYILLRDFVERSARNDYNWSKPNRRYFPQGLVLPSLISEQIPEIAVFIDSSGSISQEQCSKFTAEASNILMAYDTTLRVFSIDAQIQSEQEFTKADMPFTVEIKGGGGTDFRPAFEEINKKGYSPACAVYLTDLDGRFPDKEPDYPVLWVSVNKNHQKAPFGTTICFND